MFDKYNFLLEIGSEEIPAGYLPPAIENYQNLFKSKLEAKNIPYEKIDVYATPRRVAITIKGLSDSQKDELIELKGPSFDRAYENGKPSKALQGFLTGNGLTEADIQKKETPKGTYVVAMKKSEPKSSSEILPEIIESAIREIPFPKKMRWSDKTITYPRPIRYILCLFNDNLLKLSIDGIVSGKLTRGHYIQSNRMLEINKISDYEKTLLDNKVLLDHKKRKETIREQLKKAADVTGGRLVDDEDLLDTVTFLVEDPHAVVCEFEPDFLKIPDIVLIAEMREHQKFFAVRDNAGKLTNKFLVVSNNPESIHVKEGNARVITARFRDAEFFYNEDRKKPLSSKIDSLKTVLFHKELGTIYDKVLRVKNIAAILKEELKIDDTTFRKIERAIMLCKADLNTAMVMEFTSLQGQVGKIYAISDGEDIEVANAIDDHYRPRFQGDVTPTALVSYIVSLSEKIDNILGSYSVGNVPKGSQDPYALRRQSFAIIDMLIKNQIQLNIDRVLNKAASAYKNGQSLVSQILDFINTRAKTRLEEEGIRYDEIDACLSVGIYDYYELSLRAKELFLFRKDDNFSKMLLGFKRMNNIVSQFVSKNKDYKLIFQSSLLIEDSEKKLYEFFNGKSESIRNFIEGNRYGEIFGILLEARPLIDKYFDDVMVMDKKTEIRDNRLAMLSDILVKFKSLIDFSKISE